MSYFFGCPADVIARDVAFKEHFWNVNVLQTVNLYNFDRICVSLVLSHGPDTVCCDIFCELFQPHQINTGIIVRL
jgi:hypothetical protein